MSGYGESERLLARARDRLVHGDTQGGMVLLKQVLAEDPGHAWAHALLSICMIDCKLVRVARVEAEAAVRADPELAIARRAMGEVQVAERKLGQAEASFRYAIELEPENADLFVRLVALLRMRDRRDEDLLVRALELAPDDPDVLVAAAYDCFDRRELDRAEGHAREALEEDPEHVDALVAMGWIRLAQGDVADAHAHVRMAMHADPTDDGALRLLGSIKARKNPILGLWWRWSMWMSSFGDERSIAILIAMFIVYRLATVFAEDMGRDDIAGIIRSVWLAFVAYTWIAPGLWQRMLQRDIAPVELGRDY
ncbi:MAG: tetratricopeptide repeat protein [Deltaproteobacteria bacterium]|nr:tetratricopeptide repeat protein [Nannocystaceae bacterium]